MKISTKVECGIIAISDIAMFSVDGETVTVYSIAERRNISAKYLEQILTSLRHSKLIKGIKGSRGGYILSKKAKEITLGEIIDALDPSIIGNEIADVNEESNKLTEAIDKFLWSKIENDVQSFTSSITLDDLVKFYENALDEQQSEPMYYI